MRTVWVAKFLISTFKFGYWQLPKWTTAWIAKFLISTFTLGLQQLPGSKIFGISNFDDDYYPNNKILKVNSSMKTLKILQFSD